jgi:hypothetical protein
MSRLSTHLDAIALWLTGEMLGAEPLVTECRRQLDLVDAEDISRVAFRSPAGFLVLPRAELIRRADGGRDAELWLGIAIAAQARPGVTADAEVIDRAIELAARLDDQDFGQDACLPPAEIELRPVLQAAIETKGIAVAVVSFRQRLLGVVPPPAASQELIGATGSGEPRPGDPQTFLRDEGGLTPEERAIVDGWSAP